MYDLCGQESQFYIYLLWLKAVARIPSCPRPPPRTGRPLAPRPRGGRRGRPGTSPCPPRCSATSASYLSALVFGCSEGDFIHWLTTCWELTPGQWLRMSGRRWWRWRAGSPRPAWCPTWHWSHPGAAAHYVTVVTIVTRRGDVDLPTIFRLGIINFYYDKLLSTNNQEYSSTCARYNCFENDLISSDPMSLSSHGLPPSNSISSHLRDLDSKVWIVKIFKKGSFWIDIYN